MRGEVGSIIPQNLTTWFMNDPLKGKSPGLRRKTFEDVRAGVLVQARQGMFLALGSRFFDWSDRFPNSTKGLILFKPFKLKVSRPYRNIYYIH